MSRHPKRHASTSHLCASAQWFLERCLDCSLVNGQVHVHSVDMHETTPSAAEECYDRLRTFEHERLAEIERARERGAPMPERGRQRIMAARRLGRASGNHHGAKDEVPNACPWNIGSNACRRSSHAPALTLEHRPLPCRTSEHEASFADRDAHAPPTCIVRSLLSSPKQPAASPLYACCARLC